MSRRRAPARLVAAGAIALLSTAGIALRFANADTSDSLANVELGSAEPLETRGAQPVHDTAPPAPTVDDLHPLPAIEGTPIDHVFTSLSGWTHPVTGSSELVPSLRSRLFGSERRGIERAECGDGHCGVDLDGPRGRPIVAVADGTVVRVERKEHGADGKSGRYVRLQHDDGTLTAYMHLDDVASALQVGDTVRAGQYVGTLGASGIFNAAPHLHFSLEVPTDPDQRGDLRATRYLDPSPFLARATIAPTPERRHAVKPAF